MCPPLLPLPLNRCYTFVLLSVPRYDLLRLFSPPFHILSYSSPSSLAAALEAHRLCPSNPPCGRWVHLRFLPPAVVYTYVCVRVCIVYVEYVGANRAEKSFSLWHAHLLSSSSSSPLLLLTYQDAKRPIHCGAAFWVVADEHTGQRTGARWMTNGLSTVYL